MENICLLRYACQVAGISTDPLLALFDYSLEYGYDKDGFYSYVPFYRPAENRQKDWLIECRKTQRSKSCQDEVHLS